MSSATAAAPSIEQPPAKSSNPTATAMSISLLVSASLPCPPPPLLRRGTRRCPEPLCASIPLPTRRGVGLAAAPGDGGGSRLVETRRMSAAGAVRVSGGGGDGGAGVGTGITAAAAATVVLAVMNQVLYKLALFFLAQVLTFGYVIVYFSILFIRYRAGIVSKEMLALPKSRFMLIGLLEAMGVASGMAAAGSLQQSR